MTVTVYIPRDAAALALGADEIAEAVAREAKARGAEVAIVRNGSRGMVWLEPYSGARARSTKGVLKLDRSEQ